MDTPDDRRELNDLAASALQGLAAAQRWIRARPMLSLGGTGFVVATVVVLAGGRVGTSRSTRALTSWLGLEDRRGLDSSDHLPAVSMLAALAVLAVLWIGTLEVIRRTAVPRRRVWWVVVAWTMPFAVGPPLVDTAVYTYAAFGLNQRNGRDPYHGSGPGSAADSALVNAIDPGLRGVPSSAGPLGSLLQHLSISITAGSVTGAVIVLRIVGVLTALAIGRLAADMGGRRSAQSLAICALNPLVLLFVVSSPHLDGLMVAVALGSLAAATQRRWLLAVALACVSGSILAPGFLLVPIVITVHWLGRRSAPVWRLIGRDVAVALIVTGAAGLAQPDGFGWVRTVSQQFGVHTPVSIANATGRVLSFIVPVATFDDLLASGRISALVAAVAVVMYLIVTARHRALERTVGYGLLAIGLLAPNLYPWYLLWGLLCLAPTATGMRRTCVIGLSIAGAGLLPMGFSDVGTHRITAVWLSVVALAVAVALYLEHRRELADAAETQQAADNEALTASNSLPAADEPR